MEANPHSADGEARIVICVRKRPISEKEVTRKDHDCVTCLHPVVWVHASKLRVDGISKYLDHSSFSLDHAFDELVTTQEVYEYSTLPLLEFTLLGTGGRATVFAYGQTGSGKVKCSLPLLVVFANRNFTNKRFSSRHTPCKEFRTWWLKNFLIYYRKEHADVLWTTRK